MPRPAWLKTRLPSGETSRDVAALLTRLRLHTVCASARCPNLGECWGRGTATFMILGDVCTRHCGFCAVTTGNPGGARDETEPDRIAEAVRELKLKHVVITSVDRDDLPDLGAEAFAAVIRGIGQIGPIGADSQPTVEVLTPDFGAREELLETVLSAHPDVFAHNVEVVRELSPRVRDRRAGYDLSLQMLSRAKQLRPEQLTKSGLMVGLGETHEQVVRTLKDLRRNQVDVVTVGQYLRPARVNLPVVEYVTPAQFEEYGQIARGLGFRTVFSAPLVRSSWHAEEAVQREASALDRRTSGSCRASN